MLAIDANIVSSLKPSPVIIWVLQKLAKRTFSQNGITEQADIFSGKPDHSEEMIRE
jgi:hypothetical protein